MKIKNFKVRSKKELTILLYHGVTDIKSNGIENYSKKHLSIDKFSEQMNFLKNNCHPLSIDDFIEIKNSKSNLPPSSVIVSFDDGFKNNYENASPILIENNIPAVFYITSGIVDTKIMFWVDIIEDCINLYNKKYIELFLESKEIIKTDQKNNKIKAIEKIKIYCKKSSQKEKDRVITELINVSKVNPNVEHSKNYEKISWKELDSMNNEKLFTIGGHSLYHNILSSLDDKTLENDIRESIELLEKNLNYEVKHYSYPEGQKNHFDKRTIDLLIKNGIICSPSAIHGMNDINSNLFELKRIMVGINKLPFPYLV
jgi:peptidoglycan/xylan/chitin deacetylase (PgdA/CDA1 family)